MPELKEIKDLTKPNQVQGTTESKLCIALVSHILTTRVSYSERDTMIYQFYNEYITTHELIEWLENNR